VLRHAVRALKRRAAPAIALGVLSILALATHDAAADTSRRARLVYIRGAGTEACPEEAELRDAVAARLGYDPFSTWAEDTLFVELAKDKDEGFVSRVKLVDVQSVVRGERELHAKNDCKDLVPTMALTISIAIDPLAGQRNGALPEDTPPREKSVDLDAGSPDPQSKPPPNEDHPPVEPHDESAKHGFVPAFGAGVLGALGNAPSANVGFSLFAEGRYAWASLGVEGRVDLPAGAEIDPARLAPATNGAGVSSWLIAGGLAACGRVSGFFGCAVGSLGSIRARGIDVTTPRETGAFYATAGIRGGYELRLIERLSLRGQVEGDAVLTRYALQIGGSEVYRYSPIAGNLGILAVLRFQ
jgi:hypothetical protein